jgi:hypothetical protein
MIIQETISIDKFILTIRKAISMVISAFIAFAPLMHLNELWEI